MPSHSQTRWMLPEGIEEVLPPVAWQVEGLRRRILDQYRSWGYELAIPPLVEYLDALQQGASQDLDLQTIKFVDPLSGRLLGLRADMTPQVARIDAHQLRREQPVRLCYLGPVLRNTPERAGGNRNPLQLGAEIYGHAGVESDIEILALMQATLRLAGISQIYLDVGHVGVFRSLSRQAGLSEADELALFEQLQRKARPEIEAKVAELGLADDVAAMICELSHLNGGPEVLDKAREVLAAGNADVQAALADLQQLADSMPRDLPGLALHLDLAELRAYQYQTGLVFAAYVPGYGQEIARGGRYDNIGKAFGRERAATGFSADMKTLLAVGELPEMAQDNVMGNAMGNAIFAPDSANNDPALKRRIADLRAEGQVVIQCLAGQQADAATMGCTRQLQREQGEWQIVDLEH